jgi:hypothetical protein
LTPIPALDEDGYVGDSTTVDLMPVPVLDENGYELEHCSRAKRSNLYGCKNDSSRLDTALVSVQDDNSYALERGFPTLPIEGISTQSVAAIDVIGPTGLILENQQQAVPATREHVSGAARILSGRVQSQPTAASLTLSDTVTGNAFRGRAASVYNGFGEDTNDELKPNEPRGALGRDLSLDLGWQEVGSDRQREDNLHPDETRL